MNSTSTHLRQEAAKVINFYAVRCFDELLDILDICLLSIDVECRRASPISFFTALFAVNHSSQRVDLPSRNGRKGKFDCCL